MMRQPTPIVRGQAASIQAPTMGWNARDSQDNMKPGFAIQLDNIFPQTNFAKLRSGFVQFCDTGQAGNVYLIEWAASNGQLLAAVGGKIFNITSGSATQLATGYGSDNWSYTSFSTSGAQYTLAVNGVDTGWRYNGSSLTPLVYTGPTNPLSLVCIHAQRPFYAEANTLKVWYPDAGTFQGSPMTAFDFGPFCVRGGTIAAIGTWTRDNGYGGADDLFVVVTTEGEILIYNGFDPNSSSTWFLVGRFLAGRPVSGKYALSRLGPDLMLICEDGFQPLSTYLETGRSQASRVAISTNIGNAVSQAVAQGSSLPGWCALLYPKGTQIIVNVPQGGSTFHQYVVNTITGAWCRYIGMNAVSWALSGGAPFFGGTDGRVYLADRGYSDNGADIVGELRTAYQYIGGRGQQKRFTMARPNLQTTYPLDFALVAETDFRTSSNLTAPSNNIGGNTSGSLWDTAVWGTDVWGAGQESGAIQATWRNVNGLGYSVSLHMKFATHSIGVNIMAFDMTYEGGLFI
jgi:hypothetical protein